MAADPRRVLQRGAALAAGRADEPLAQSVTRGFRAPADDERDDGDRRRIRTVRAIRPPPGVYALQLAESRDRRRQLARPVCGDTFTGRAAAHQLSLTTRGRDARPGPIDGAGGFLRIRTR